MLENVSNQHSDRPPTLEQSQRAFSTAHYCQTISKPILHGKTHLQIPVPLQTQPVVLAFLGINPYPTWWVTTNRMSPE